MSVKTVFFFFCFLFFFLLLLLLSPTLLQTQPQGHPWRPRGGRSGRTKGVESFKERVREPPGCHSQCTNSTTYSNASLWLGAKNIFVPNHRQAPVALFLWISHTKKFTCKLDCLPHLSGSCVGAFFEKNFSVQMGPTNPKITHNLACKVRFPYNRIHLSCIYVSNLFILTIWEKKYEIVACIINLWGYIEISPNLKCTNRRNQNVDWWKVNSLTLEYL